MAIRTDFGGSLKSGTTAYKTANTARTSTTSPAADPHLTFAIGANETFYFRFIVYVTAASATPDIKGGINGPTSPANIRWQEKLYSNNNAIVGGAGASAYNTGFNFALNNTDFFHFEIEGTIENGSTAGSVSFDWAQDNSSSDATTVLRGSSVFSQKL